MSYLRKIRNPDVYYPLIAVGTNLIVYWRWFNLNALYTIGDWGFFFRHTLQELFNLNSAWSVSGLGQLNITLSGFPVNYLLGAFAHFFSYALIEKLFFMWPIVVVSSLGSYFLVRNQGLSRVASLIGCWIFTFNTYTLLLSIGHLNLMAAGAFCLPSIIYFQNYLKTNRKAHLALSLGSAFIAGAYDARVIYILSGILVLYVLFSIIFKGTKSPLQALKNLIFWISGLILLNAYWLIPLTKLGQVTNNAIFSRGLFGSQFLNLQQSLSLFQPFWTGAKPTSFLVQPVPNYFWIIPILATFGLYLNRKNRSILFFGVIAFLGILLTKQIDSPFPDLYPWLYEHLPGFNAFREASKFYFLIALGYSVLIAALVDWILIKRPKLNNFVALLYIAVGLIGLIFLWNTRPLIDGRIGNTFVPRNVPSDYSKLEKIILAQPAYFRTYWLPISSRFGTYDNNHPEINSTDIASNYWQSILDDAQPVSTQKYLTKPLTLNYSSVLFASASVKYVIVPIRDIANDDDFFVSYGDDRQYYLNILNSLPWLKKIDIGTSNLAVYENKDYKPYFSPVSSPTVLQSLDNVEQVYQFAQSQKINNEFSFKLGAVPTNNQSEILDIFNNLKRENLIKGALAVKTNTNRDESLVVYSNTNQPIVSYQVKDNNLTIYSQNLAGPTIQNIPPNTAKGTKAIIGTATLEPSKEYYVNLGSNLLKVDPKFPQRNLGKITDAPSIMVASSKNLISNPSLEQGLWKSKVGDCNKYNKRAVISQGLDQKDKTEGNQSLVLKSRSHIACTGPNKIPVTSQSDYLLSFDYKVKDGQQAGYQITFIGSRTKPLENDLYTKDNAWRSEITKITVPSDAKGIGLLFKGFPDDQNKSISVTHYDNLRLSALSQITQTALDTTPHYSKMDIQNGGKVEADFKDKDFSYQNLVSDPSFKDGLWQKQVGDCDNYDTNAKLAMELSNVHSFGAEKSLELDATRHIACTGPAPIAIKENSQYLLSFDYQSPNGANAGFFVGFNDPAHTLLSGKLPITDKNWHNFAKTITAPYGATQMGLVIYSYSAARGNQKIITRYDNFYFTQIPNIQDQYYLVSNPKTAFKQPKSIGFTSNSPTNKTVDIKGAATPFYLAMSEAYDAHWQLELKDSAVRGLGSWLPTAQPHAVPAANHIDLNNYENGWYIDPPQLCASKSSACSRNADGSYNLKLVAEFTPQRYLYVGLIISGLSLAGCIGYLLRSYRPKRGQFKRWQYIRKR